MTSDVQGGHGPGFEGSFRSPKGQQLAELAVFLFLIVPTLLLSLVVGVGVSVSFVVTATAVIVRDIALVALIVYFLKRNGEPLRAVGWHRARLGREVLWGLVLALPVWAGAQIFDAFLTHVGFTSPATLPSGMIAHGPAQILLALALVIVVAVCEETIFRGYLILRFRNLGTGAAVAAVLSSVIFAIGHGYEGSAGVVSVGLTGLAFAVVYLWRKSLVAPMVMHFIYDFVGIVLVAWLAGH